MGHSLGDALIVASLAAVGIAFMFLRSRERQRRQEMVHKERLAAMDKGIPLPELPFDPPHVPKPADPRVPLMHGIVWLAFGIGGVATMSVIGPIRNIPLWPMPLPLVFLGAGLVLYYVLASRQR
jgi:Domain of unknown function (DUF6249)